MSPVVQGSRERTTVGISGAGLRLNGGDASRTIKNKLPLIAVSAWGCVSFCAQRFSGASLCAIQCNCPYWRTPGSG